MHIKVKKHVYPATSSYIDRYFDNIVDAWLEYEDAQFDEIDRKIESEKKSKESKHLHSNDIKSVEYNHRSTIVKFKDGSKTAVCDETIDRNDSISISKDGKTMEIKDSNGNKTKRDYVKWKEDGLTSALAKHAYPKYFDILREWCE